MAELTAQAFQNDVNNTAGLYVYLTDEDYRASDVAATFAAAATTGGTGLYQSALETQAAYLGYLNGYGLDIDVMDIVAELGSYDTLEQILEEGANYINSAISRYGGSFSTFSTRRGDAYSAAFAGQYEAEKKGGVSAEQINRLFDSILSAQGMVENCQLGAIWLLKAVANKEHTLTDVEAAWVQQAGATARVLLGIIQTGGFVKGSTNVNVGSIVGSLNNIYGSGLGEEIIADFFENLPNNEEVNSAIVKGLTINTSNIKTTLEGTQKDETRHTFKTDIGLTGLMSYTASKSDDSNYSLEVGSNISAKWSQKAKNAGAKGAAIKIVSGTPLRDYLSQIQLGNGDTLSYIGNAFAHEPSGGSVMKTVRQTFVANCANEWLTGKGVTGTPQYLFLNGKVYSMLDVLKNALKTEGNSSAMSVQFKGYDSVAAANTVESPPNRRRVKAAVRRNEKVRNAINKISLSATLNTKFLTLT